MDEKWGQWKDLTGDTKLKELIKSAEDKLKTSQSKGKGKANSAPGCQERMGNVSPSGRRTANTLGDMRNGRLRHIIGELLVGQWNVEGPSESKAVQLQLIMERRGVGILCMHETHQRNSDYYILLRVSWSFCPGSQQKAANMQELGSCLHLG